MGVETVARGWPAWALLCLAAACGGKARSNGDGAVTDGGGRGPGVATTSDSGGGPNETAVQSSTAGGSSAGGVGGGTRVETALAFRTLRAGLDEYCGITQDEGRLVCVSGDEISFEEPGPFVAFDMSDQASGWDYRCGVRESGELFCFGETELAPPEGTFNDVSVGVFNACARSQSGLECWVPPELGGIEPPLGAGLSYSVDMWSFCTQLDTLHGQCSGRDGEALVPDEGHYLWLAAAPLAGCGAVLGEGGDVSDSSLSPLDAVLIDAISCFDQEEARPKLGGLFTLFDVNANEDGCALGQPTGETGGRIACWGAFEGSVPADYGTGVEDISVSLGQACFLDSDGQVTCFPSAG